ncbi:MAG TPA: hypothetical protein VGX23_32045 [Actinocrinis sp.]|nr:hypothetical protein [Actinocrinis sp.]
METGDSRTDAERDRFGQDVADRIRQLDVVAAADYEPDGFRVVYLRHGETNRGHAYLESTFLECRGVTAAERDRRIDALASIAMAPQLPKTWDEVRPMLRPVLRAAAFGLGESAAKELVRRPAMPYLTELVVVDTPRAMAYVNVVNLGQWGVTAEDVFSAARSNMADTAMRTMERDEEGPALIRFVDDGDGYFSSLPLIGGWLAGIGARLGARPLAFVAERNSLLVTGVPWTEPSDLDPLLAMVLEDYREAPRSISPVAYTVDEDGEVVEFEVPRGHPSWAAVRRAQIVLATEAYRSQTQYLKARYEQEGTDVFVAGLQSLRSPTGLEFTMTAWTDEIVTHLPRAHYIAFPGDEPGGTILVPWAAVDAEAGFVPVPGLHPPRFEVGDWPEPERMARVRSQAEMP